MNCFDPTLRRRLARAGYDHFAAEIERTHTRLLKQRLPQIHTASETEQGVTLGWAFVVWQASLHRVGRLLLTTCSSIENADMYGFSTLLRAMIESTAVLASVCSQLHGWADGSVSYEVADASIHAALAGSRSATRKAEAPAATNILTHLRRADRFIKEKQLISDEPSLLLVYEALSEVAHPNLTSNAQAFRLIAPATFEFQHGREIPKGLLDLLPMLQVVSGVYESVSGFFYRLLNGDLAQHTEAEIVPFPSADTT